MNKLELISALKNEANISKAEAAKVVQITEQLAYKRYHTGRYYEKVGNEEGASLYYQMVIDNWPQTAAADMARAAMDRLLPKRFSKHEP